jgi:D-beta-D-heptose 7-phosphate kinase/D-beta-D-heptose 1-phosphate adenosyltransferase
MINVVVNGTFDILHRGHIEMLEYAKSLGDHLLVCIDTDSRVSELKGTNRPINKQSDRAFMLQSLRCVDTVWYFDDEEQLEEILETYKPDVMVKGSDYKDKPIVGSQYCKEIKFVDLVNGYSTTKTIQNIIAR